MRINVLLLGASLTALAYSPCGAQSTTTFAYDAQGQLTGVSRSTGTTGYSYDAAGNRVQVSIGVQPATAGAVSKTTDFNTSASIQLQPGGNYTSLAIASTPAQGTLSPISGTTTVYTPTTGYAGSDSFTYTATGPLGTSSPGTVSITVSPPAGLIATISSTTYYRAKIGPTWENTGEPSSVTMTAVGGTAPYSYAWERYSGDSQTAAASPSAATTYWQRVMNNSVDASYNSVWRGKITDAIGQSSYTPQVTVTVEQFAQ